MSPRPSRTERVRQVDEDFAAEAALPSAMQCEDPIGGLKADRDAGDPAADGPGGCRDAFAKRVVRRPSTSFNTGVDTVGGAPLGLPQVLIPCPPWATPQKAAIAMFVCLCTGATREVVAEAVAMGARTSKQIAASCGAGADCGRCRRTVREIIASSCQVFATPALPLAVSC